RKFLLNLTEVFYIEKFFLGTTTVPVGNFTVGLFGMEQVENLSTQRCHAGTTANVYHFALGTVNVEFTVRTGDGYLIAWLTGEYIRRTDTRIYIHPLIIGTIPRRCGNTDVQHHNVSFSRVVGHGVSPEDGLIVFHFQIPQLELIPIALKYIGLVAQLRMRSDVHGFEIYIYGGNVN